MELESKCSHTPTHFFYPVFQNFVAEKSFKKIQPIKILIMIFRSQSSFLKKP